MPQFHYYAIDDQGQPQTGDLDAADAAAARRQLEERGWHVGSIESVAEELPKGRLSSEEESQFGIHLAEAVGAELPLPECLRAIADEIGSGRVANALRRVADGVAAGRALPDALNECGAGLPEHLRGLITAGLRSGRVDAALIEFTELKRRRNQMRDQLRATLMYPLVLIVILLSVAVFILLTVVPMYAQIFDDFKMPLPMMTAFIVWLAGPGIRGFLIVVGSLAALMLLATLLAGRGPWHAIRRWLPIVGVVYRCHAICDFSQLLGALLSQGIPLPEALRLAGRGVSDALVPPVSKRLAASVEQGTPLADALRSGWPRPLAALAPIVQWGQRHNALPDALRASAAIYSERADAQLDLMQMILPPTVFLLVAVCGGLLIISMFLPLIRLVDSLT